MVNVKIDFKNTIGKLKPMNAVNNGPIIARKDQSRGNDDAFRAAKIPYARTHDSSAYAGYGGHHTVDIQAIFKNFDADVNDPASYDFIVTDKYVSNIQSVGTKVYYRLGTKIEHGVKKFDIFPPKDNQKWAEICEHIIAHYTEGWADGFNYDIEYWEIWNEPDLDPDERPMNEHRCWGGTSKEFYEFFRVAATHLKSRFPHLKIGGPAMAKLQYEGKWFEDFLVYMKENNVPMDFFSWHVYSATVEKIEDRAAYIRQRLDYYGYTDTESILNEWNYVRGWSEEFIYSIEQVISQKGAAFTASVMSACQAGSVDMLMYYDARPTVFNGLFDFYTCRPLKGYYPFYYFGKLADMKEQSAALSSDSDIRLTAAYDGKSAGAMISYFAEPDDAEAKEITLTLDLDGEYKLYTVDADKTNEESLIEIRAGEPVTLCMKPQTVIYLEK